MENFLEHIEFYNKGIRNDFNTVTPEEIFIDYCSNFDLASVRNYLWNYFVVAPTSDNYRFREPFERSNLLAFVIETEKVLEVVYMLRNGLKTPP